MGPGFRRDDTDVCCVSFASLGQRAAAVLGAREGLIARHHGELLVVVPRLLRFPATLSYLKAVKAAGTKDSDAVAKKLKELPVDDAFAQGKVQENGRMVHDMYLFEVKKPSESKKPWDYYKQLAVVPGDQAFPRAKDVVPGLTRDP
jgi:hypothetical protein